MHAIHPRDFGTLLRRLRPSARLAAGVVAVSALTGVCALPANAAPPPSAGMTPFAAGNPIVFIEQGLNKSGGSTDPFTQTQLYSAEQTPGAGISFVKTVSPVPILYNAMGFNLSDMYLYAFQVNSTTLLRIGSDGSVQTLGKVSGLPGALNSAGLNAGAFGDGSCTLTNCQNILFVRQGNDTANPKTLWKVDITTMSATALTLSQSVPNTADLTFSQGYLWSVYGNGSGTTVTVYRIDPVTGHVDTFTMPGTGNTTPTTSAIIKQSYGAQWTYGNGNIGIAGNEIGVAYQIQITNPSDASPTFTIVSAVPAPISSQNDGAAYPGAPVDMGIQKAAKIAYNAGTGKFDVTYTLTVKNNSANVYSSGSTVTDPLPAGLTVDPASLPSGCAINAANVLSCTVGPLQGGKSISIPIQGTLPGTASGTITNTATVTGNEDDPDPTNNTSSATVDPKAPVVSITKTAEPTGALKPGDTITYHVTVTNTGTVDASGTKVNDPVPAGIGSVSWTCQASATNAACTNTSGSGALKDEPVATLKPGGYVVYTITGTVLGGVTSVTNTATATPPGGGLCADGTPVPCSSGPVTNPLPPVVSITKKSYATGPLTPGDTVIYRVTVANTGSVDASGTAVNDSLPAGIVSATWRCRAYGGAACPNASGSGGIISQTLSTFPAGTSVVYTIRATVAASGLPAKIVNTATAQPPGGGLCADGGPLPCKSTASDLTVPMVQITKTSSAPGALVAGQTVTYTVTVTNTSGADASGTTVYDPLPSGIVSASWACAATGGAVCPHPNGINAINETLSTFPAYSSLVYVITAQVVHDSQDLPSVVVNAATVTPPGDGVCVGNGSAPCRAEVANPPVPIVSIKKQSDSTGALNPGDPVSYKITVTNTGAVDATGTVVRDTLPTGIDSATVHWSCSGAACPSPTSGSGVDTNGYIINQTLGAFPAGGTVVYTITANAATSGLPAVVVNTATANPPGGNGVCEGSTAPPPCKSEVTNPSVPIVKITKSTTTKTALTPGGKVSYTITVTNTGAVDAGGTEVIDGLPDGIASTTWTCAATGGAACPHPNGNGPLDEILTTFPAGSSVIYTVDAIARTSGLPAVVVNTATATPPDGGLCDDGSPLPCNSDTVPNPSVPVVSINKAANSTAALTPGGTVTYTVTVKNVGTVNAANTVISDPLPPGIARASWTCVATGGAVCPYLNGTGAINETLTTFPVGGSVIYTITATAVTSGLPAVVVNTATANPPGGVCAPNGSTPPCSAEVTNPVTPREAPGGGSGTTPVPALDARALALLAALLAGLAWFSRRKMGRR